MSAKGKDLREHLNIILYCRQLCVSLTARAIVKCRLHTEHHSKIVPNYHNQDWNMPFEDFRVVLWFWSL